MSRLDDYRAILLAGHAEVGDPELRGALDARDATFVSLVVSHGLGPLWHERTGRDEFHQSRMAAEAQYAAQERDSSVLTCGPDD